MATIDEIATALNKAADAGDHEAAKELATAYNQLKTSSSDWENDAPLEGMKQPEQSTLEKVGDYFNPKHTAENLKNIYAGVAREIAFPLNYFPEASNKVNKSLQSLGVNTESTPYEFGKLAGNIALGTGVAGALGKGAEVLGASPNITKALYSSGMEAPSSSLAKSLTRQALAGGLTGGATTLLTNPEDTGTGATIGAVLPVGFRGLGALGRFGADLVLGGLSKTNAKAVLEKVMGDKLEASKQALESLPTDTNLTTGQALHGISDPKVAALEEMGRVTNGQPFLNKDIAQRQEWVDANKAVSPNLEPAIAHEANVNLAREAELNTLQGTKEQDLANRIRQFEQGTAKETPQIGLGQDIIDRKKALENIAKQKSDLNYENAFALAPKLVDVGHVASKASGIANDLQSLINPKADTKLANSIKRIFTPTEAKAAQNIYGPSGITGQTKAVEASPPMATLSDLHKVNAALNEQIYNPNIDNTTYARLNQLKTKIQDTINNPEVFPEEAINAYQNAQTEWKNTVQRPFREGQAEKLTRLNSVGRPTTLPEDAVDSFLKKESYARDFNRMAGNDPQAIQALRTGIEQKMMNSPNPEKFLQDNRFALDTLGPEIKTNLNALAEKIRTHGVEGKALETERSAIPKTVLTESEQAASPANQARLLKEGIETALPNINEGSLNKLNPEAFLSFMRNNRGNIENQLTDIGQQGSLNQIRSNMIRNQEMQAMAKANREPVEKIIESESLRQRLPSLINPAIAFLNMGIRQTEGKISGATGRELSQAMSNPKYALDLFKHLPADQRMALLRNLRASGPTLSRAAIAETNQQ